MSFPTEKVHIFKPSEFLIEHAKANINVEGATEMLNIYSFTATHGPRQLESEIEERAKQIFIMSMLFENISFFETFNFKQVSPTDLVDQLWAYENFEVESSLNRVWEGYASKAKDIKKISFIDQNKWVIFD